MGIIGYAVHERKNIIIQQKETVLDYHWHDIYSGYYKSGKEYTEYSYLCREYKGAISLLCL